MKRKHWYLMYIGICLAFTSCKEGHDKAAKSKYGDANRIKCVVIARGGIGATLDSVLSGTSVGIPIQSLASILKLPGSGVLRENLVICEKRWYWGGAKQGYKWFEVKNRKTLVISTPSSVPSSQDIIVYTTGRHYGKKGEYRNYDVLGSIGNFEVWRYTDSIKAGGSSTPSPQRAPVAQRRSSTATDSHKSSTHSSSDSEEDVTPKQSEKEKAEEILAKCLSDYKRLEERQLPLDGWGDDKWRKEIKDLSAKVYEIKQIIQESSERTSLSRKLGTVHAYATNCYQICQVIDRLEDEKGNVGLLREWAKKLRETCRGNRLLLRTYGKKADEAERRANYLE